MASASFGDNTQAYTYDNRLQTVTNTVKNSFQTTLYSESNTFNSAGNMTESVTAFYDTQSRTKTLAHSYSYDIFGQLTGEQYKQSGVTLYANAFDYDFSGNLTELNNETFGVNEKNQLEATVDDSESTTLVYDDNGNLLSRSYLDEEEQIIHTETYVYDVWGHMVESDVNGMVTTYTYYPDGLRKTKTVNEKTTRYYYDGDVVVNEAVNGQWSASNVKALGNRIVKRTTEGGENALMYNSRGDVVMILAWENSAEPVAAYLYLAYGKLYSDLSDFYGMATLYDPYVFDCPILYAGQYYDNETGLYYLRARYYSPDLCRFISEDTHWHIGNMIYGDGNSKTPSLAAILQSNNLYAYCAGNPVMRVDPTGQAWWHWALAGAIVVAAAAAVVVTAGGAAPALLAVASVASGMAAATTASTVAAGAFIYSSVTLSGFAYMAISDSDSLEDFNERGSLGTVIYTGISALIGALMGYAMSPKTTNKGAGNSNILSNKTQTNQTKEVNNYVSGTKGNDAAQADFNALNPSNVKTYSNGTVVGELSNGTTVNLHRSSSLGGTPTLEIYDPTTGLSIKIRY